MKIYILSYNGCNGNIQPADGVLGTFDSLARAESEMDKYCTYYQETQIDYDSDMIVWHFFTNKGTYTIERFELNESCFEDEDEDNADYIPDDVDETFYDPYAGCDIYE